VSIHHYEKLNCPHCGNELEMLLWDSLNADLDPQARTALLDGSLNNAVCQVCHKNVEVLKDLLYHDMTRKFFVYYLPFEKIDEPGYFEEFSRDGQLILQAYRKKTGLDMPVYVFTMEELTRYIIFREKLSETWNLTERRLDAG
jgi:hypothetical protein